MILYVYSQDSNTELLENRSTAETSPKMDTNGTDGRAKSETEKETATLTNAESVQEKSVGSDEGKEEMAEGGQDEPEKAELKEQRGESQRAESEKDNDIGVPENKSTEIAMHVQCKGPEAEGKEVEKSEDTQSQNESSDAIKPNVTDETGRITGCKDLESGSAGASETPVEEEDQNADKGEAMEVDESESISTQEILDQTNKDSNMSSQIREGLTPTNILESQSLDESNSQVPVFQRLETESRPFDEQGSQSQSQSRLSISGDINIISDDSNPVKSIDADDNAVDVDLSQCIQLKSDSTVLPSSDEQSRTVDKTNGEKDASSEVAVKSCISTESNDGADASMGQAEDDEGKCDERQEVVGEESNQEPGEEDGEPPAKRKRDADETSVEDVASTAQNGTAEIKENGGDNVMENGEGGAEENGVEQKGEEENA